MKILFINSLPAYGSCVSGGAEKTINGQMKAVRAAGADVSILSLGEVSKLTKETANGMNRWVAPLRNLYFLYGKKEKPFLARALWHAIDMYNPLMKPFIRQVISAEKPDVVSLHNLAGWSISAWDAISDSNVPIVQVLHDQYLLCPRSTMLSGEDICDGQCLQCRILRLPHKRKSEMVTGVVGVSKFILNKFLRHGYFSKAHVREAIHNSRSFPVDFSTIRPRPADGNVIFGFIGTIAPNKGIEILLDTFVRHAPLNWRLKVAGVGKPEYTSALTERYGSHPKISFIGYTKQQDFFPQIDITVVPSIAEEALCCVVFESHMFGVPTVGSNFGGIPEMITPGVNGVFCDPKTSGNLYRSMCAVAQNLDEYRANFGDVMKSAEKHTDSDLWAKQWMGVYERSVCVFRSAHATSFSAARFSPAENSLQVDRLKGGVCQK